MGAGETGKLIAQSLMDDCYLGYQVYGFLEDDPVKKAKGIIINNCTYKVLGGFNDATAVIQDNYIRNVIIATPGLPGSELVKLTNRLKAYTHSIHVVPDLIGFPVNEVQVDYYCNDQIIGYSTCNNLAKPLNLFAKRIFDLVIGMIAFVAVIPVMAVIFLAVNIDSQGPAIYSGKRIGQNGKEFKCYKFRTMFIGNEEILDRYLTENPLVTDQWIKYAKLRGYDPRVTKIGNLLRKSSLDELPQILNVLKGDMSLVGARPYLPREKNDMGLEAAATILTAKPGITGLWQVSGRGDIDFKGRLYLETWYVRNWSLWLDISLLFRTVGAVVNKGGAY
jgi:undecaprenyl-phosphate galactose phosphotransferase